MYGVAQMAHTRFPGVSGRHPQLLKTPQSQRGLESLVMLTRDFWTPRGAGLEAGSAIGH